MEKKKINFNNIKGMLSNDQMKTIKGGSSGNAACGTWCWVGNNPNGSCGYYNSVCACFGQGGTTIVYGGGCAS